MTATADLIAREILIPDFVALTLGLAVCLSGAELTRRVAFPRDCNIPEPASGGIVAALAVTAMHSLFNVNISFEMETRDGLLVLFFAGIGLNARFSDLVRGGKPLAILLGVTVACLMLQNIVGAAGAVTFGLLSQAGVLLGSAWLMGGHGAAIAWAPDIGATYGVEGAMGMGVAAATLGLVAASLIGGPIARFLIERNNLTPDRPAEDLTVGLAFDEEKNRADHPSGHRPVGPQAAAGVGVLRGSGERLHDPVVSLLLAFLFRLHPENRLRI